MQIITVKVPDELYEKMKRHREINWSEVIRQAIEKKINELENVKSGDELLHELERLGIRVEDIVVEPPQGEYKFQEELRKRSTIRTY
jgi:predicted CopG family antitoxin